MRATAIALVTTLLAAAPLGAQASERGTLLDVLKSSRDFSTLVAALEFTGLDAAVADPDAELTVFIPTNRAFERTLDELGLEAADLLTEENKELTTQILLYHVLEGKVFRRDVLGLDGASVPTLQGDSIGIDILFRWFIRLNDDTYVIYPDIRASNGVAHAINRVLLPPSEFQGPTLLEQLRSDPQFSTLLAALEFTGLDATLDDPAQDLTLLAPNNHAFLRTLSSLGLTAADLLTEENKELTTQILLYHVIEGEARRSDVLQLDGQDVPTLQGDTIRVDVLFGWFIRLNGNTFVIKADIDGSNGIAHALNRVLLPPSLFASDDTIFDRLQANDEFSILVAALEFTGLDAVLDDPDAELTLLAPNNHAFERTLRRIGLEAGDLLTEENKDLTTEILLYHVIEGEVGSDAVKAAAGTRVPTVQGEGVRVDVLFRSLIILNRSVLVFRKDVDASNGVTHDITGVLLPPSLGLH